MTLRKFLSGIRRSSLAPQTDVLQETGATHRLRVVAIGVLITVAGLLNLAVYMLLNRHAAMRVSGFLTVELLGVLALVWVAITPWSGILHTNWAIRALYGWSIYGVLLVGMAVYFDGGGTSTMFLMYSVLLVFFAVAYTLRAQAILLALTIGSYLLVLALHGWNITAADLYLRLATLVLMAYVASVLSGWLVSEMRDRAHSTSTAEQRAGMLDTVARAARRVSSLDASQVVSGALSGAVELGCLAAEVWFFDGDPRVLHLQRRLAVDESAPNAELAESVFVKVRISGTTQIVEQESDSFIACMLFREGEPAGLLLAKIIDGENADALFVECVELLAAQVSAGLDVARNVAERRDLEERLAHWAFHDSLTDLPNRVLFADRLELALARTVRDNTQVAVLFLDLDDFKGVNDTLGHSAGDELLQSIAHRLHACLRPNDTLARYGGDEFVVLVEQITGPEDAVGVATRILEALDRPVTVLGTDLTVKTSIGIALTDARPGADADVLRRADMAMYEAKATGGSCYVLSQTPDTERGSATRRATQPTDAAEDAS